MRLVVLYGPAGVGKLTVGTELAELTGFKLFHNHLTVNLVTSVFTPGSEAWNRLAARIRLDVFAEAAEQGVDLILTRAPRTADQAEVDRVRTMIETVRLAGGTVLFVQLACDREELLVRVQTDARRAHNKLTDPDVLVDLFDLDATPRSIHTCGLIRLTCHPRRPQHGSRATSPCRRAADPGGAARSRGRQA
jgi:AAA domain